jgi:ribosomal protein S18 acetylase RimI-like enzyme
VNKEVVERAVLEDRKDDMVHRLVGLEDKGIGIRRCKNEDVGAVLCLWSAARSSRASTADRREDIEALLQDSPAALLVAEADGLVIGAVIAGWDGWRGNIYRLAIHPEYRRRGIGLQLLRAAETYLRDCGAGRITALVAFDDAVAAAFWDAAGYPQDAEIGRRVRNV